jgi:alkanesulfonate monooxygenase SsuD/methylene tetrahydromethanopterin reductase-like flavin-dependent oxidoreductase (luciferase family)
MAGAVIGRTRDMPVLVAACLVPLHDPVRLAEQLAVLDLASGGRVGIVAGTGYVKGEFVMAGLDRRDRVALQEEAIRVLRAAWTGESFEYAGRTVRVTPTPVSRPHPRMYLGGSAESAARRAARLRLGFYCAVGDLGLRAIYEEECRTEGFAGVSIVPTWPGFVHVSEDPEQAWAQIVDYAWYDASTYRDWQMKGQRSSVQSFAENLAQLQREGIYRVFTPDECVAFAEQQGPDGKLTLHPLLAGMPVDLGWQSLELFASKVLPRIRNGPAYEGARVDGWAGVRVDLDAGTAASTGTVTR